jgi:hypothetical protein
MRLVIGAGDRRLLGFVHHDIQPLQGIDIVCDLFDLTHYVSAGSCQEIHMTHVLEHFPMADVLSVLEIVYSLLEKGGKLYLEVPNFEWQAQELIRNPLNRKIVEYAYGGQLNQWDFHYNGFTPDILAEDLVTADFRVDELRPNSSIEVWCTKT